MTLKRDDKAHRSMIVERYRSNNPSSYLITKAKRRATLQGVPFDLKPDDFEIPEFCPVLGIPLYRGSKNGYNSPSLDRIRPALGYVRGNIVVVSWRANMLKKDATIEELIGLAKFYRRFK